MKKVLVTSRSFGSISDEPKRILEDAGFEITFKGKDLKLEEFEAIIPEYDALIIGAHAFRPEVRGHGALRQSQAHLQARRRP